MGGKHLGTTEYVARQSQGLPPAACSYRYHQSIGGGDEHPPLPAAKSCNVTLGAGVVAGATNGCTTSLASGSTCDVKCDDANGYQTNRLTYSCSEGTLSGGLTCTGEWVGAAPSESRGKSSLTRDRGPRCGMYTPCGMLSPTAVKSTWDDTLPDTLARAPCLGTPWHPGTLAPWRLPCHPGWQEGLPSPHCSQPQG